MKALESLLPRASTQIVVRCAVDYGLDSTIVPAPDMAHTVTVRITGLPEADNHVDAFKKEVEDACLADNLAVYTPRANLAKDEVAVRMTIKAVLGLTTEGAAPNSCQEDAIRKFTGPTDFSSYDYLGF